MAEQAKQPEAEKPQKAEKAEKAEKPEKPEKTEKGEKGEKTSAPAAPAAAPAAKKKIRRSVSRGIVYVKATFNNTLVTVTDTNGDTLVRESAGTAGFKGSRKSTPFAAQRAAEQAASKARKMGLNEVEVRVKGPGSGRESAITALQAAGLKIISIEDITPIPHNGCRPRKKRRV
jgi:small subunit ribosomal protein S11